MTARTAPAQVKPLFAINPVHSFVIDEPAFPPQKNVNPLIAISHPGRRDLLDPLSKQRVGILAGSVRIDRAMREQHAAGSPGGYSIGVSQIIDQLPLPGRLQSFFGLYIINGGHRHSLN
jgi:hypothetical protein